MAPTPNQLSVVGCLIAAALALCTLVDVVVSGAYFISTCFNNVTHGTEICTLYQGQVLGPLAFGMRLLELGCVFVLFMLLSFPGWKTWKDKAFHSRPYSSTLFLLLGVSSLFLFGRLVAEGFAEPCFNSTLANGTSCAGHEQVNFLLYAVASGLQPFRDGLMLWTCAAFCLAFINDEDPHRDTHALVSVFPISIYVTLGTQIVWEFIPLLSLYLSGSNLAGRSLLPDVAVAFEATLTWIWKVKLVQILKLKQSDLKRDPFHKELELGVIDADFPPTLGNAPRAFQFYYSTAPVVPVVLDEVTGQPPPATPASKKPKTKKLRKKSEEFQGY